MQLHDLRHWQWLVIGLVLGGLMGAVRAYWVSTAEPARFDQGFRDGRRVEEFLTQRHPINKEYPFFSEVRVYPYEGRQVLVGTYMARISSWGNAPRNDRGKIEEIYEQRTLVLLPETAVYVPSSPRLKNLMPPEAHVRIILDPQRVEELTPRLAQYGFKQTESPKPHVMLGTIPRASVRDLARMKGIEDILPATEADSLLGFLRAAQQKNADWKIEFRYAWWNEPWNQFAFYTLGGAVLIGGIWPFIVNLLSFGTLRHPPREKGIDLRKVKSAPTGPAAAKPTVDPAELAAHIQQLEQEIGVTTSTTPAPAATDNSPAAPAIRKLDEGPLEAPQGLPAPEKPRHYAGEFYPTVAHAPKDKS